MGKVNPYLELLKEAVVDRCAQSDPSISRLAELRMQDFKRMAAIIQATLQSVSDNRRGESGVMVSVSTLRRMFRYGYSPDIKDARITASLNKLSVFIGYASWQAFIETKQQEYGITKISLEEALETIVCIANEAELRAYKRLPEIYTDDLDRCMIREGTAYMRIFNVLNEHSKKGWTIGNPGNPSGYNVLKMRIDKVTSKEVTIKTMEYWYLRWCDTETGKYRHIYNEKNVQTWTLQFVDGTWKVLSTYYPGPKNSIHITHLIITKIKKKLFFIKN